jgi:hypothetical protein
MNQKVAACTLFSSNHLPRGRVLEKSLHRTNPDVDLFMLIVDLASVPEEAAPAKTTLLGYTDVIDKSVADHLSALYSPLSYSASFKPVLIKLLFEMGYERVLYFDSDIYVTSCVEGIVNELAECEILITPHLTSPIPFDGRRPNELTIIKYGAFNSGFIGVSRGRSSEEFLAWWSSRLKTHGFDDQPAGMFADQLWVDLVPGLFSEVRIARHPGYNLAYWNLHGRRVACERGQWKVDDKDLVFFHFSGYDPEQPGELSRHQDRLRLSEHEGMKALADMYGEDLRAADFDGSSKLPYRFDFFTNGVQFTSFCRYLLRTRPKLLQAFPRPLQSDDSPSFFAWLHEKVWLGPDGSRLSRYLMEYYRCRPDLQNAFPDPVDRDFNNLVGWLSTEPNGIPSAFRSLGRPEADA